MSEAAEDEPEIPTSVWPIVRLRFERRTITYESGEVDVEEWDGEDWVAIEDD